MADAKDIENVMRAALQLDFDTWLKVSKAITRTFAEKEHRERKSLKLDDVERVKYFYREL